VSDHSREHAEVHRTRSAKASREHALVLTSRRIPFVHVLVDGEHLIAVPVDLADDARRELARYADENANWPPQRRDPLTLADGKLAALCWSATLTAAFLLQSDRSFGLDWYRAGRGDAQAILAGEWWRTVTPLMLHADLLHLASNLVFGVLFAVFVSHLLGTGVGLLALLVSGALGNALSALVQSPPHLFVGASTSVFAGVGLYMGFLWVDRRRQRYGPLHVWTPILCGMLFLGWFGMGDASETAGVTDETDVIAHATGFVAGLAVGIATALFAVRQLRRPGVQPTAGLIAAALIAAAWIAAFAV
jgi:membrane associated rhomboid family serine protease